MKKIVLSNRQAFTLIILLIFILVMIISFFTNKCYASYRGYVFAKENSALFDLNQSNVFKIEKITFFSSVDAQDNTAEKSMKNINISQFTDIAIYIDNTSFVSELGNKNTIKNLYISDISISSNEEEGIKSLTYKNPTNFGKYEGTKASVNYTKENQNFANIYFDTIYTNGETNYDMPVFYTDCTNPISLTFINKDIVSNLNVPDNTNIDLNGQLLKHINYPTKDLLTTISFTINIENNDNELFTYQVKFDLDPDSSSELSSNGFSYQSRESSINEGVFFQAR